jgi:hypothetical protein
MIKAKMNKTFSRLSAFDNTYAIDYYKNITEIRLFIFLLRYKNLWIKLYFLFILKM